jgi:hypothetical protein
MGLGRLVRKFERRRSRTAHAIKVSIGGNHSVLLGRAGIARGSAGFLVLSLAALPFDSPALIVDVCTSVAMFVLSLPRHRRDLSIRGPSV